MSTGNFKFFKKSEQPTHSALHSPQKDVQVKTHDALHLAQLHVLALGQAGQRTAVEAAQLGQLGVIAGVHEGAGLWQLQRTALLEHLTDELGAEIMPAALPADMHPAEQQTQRIEAVELPVVHHVLGAALGAGVGFVRHFQRVEGAGDVLPHKKHAPVQVLPAGTCGEHGITILAGRAVEGAQVLVEGEGDVGVLRTGQAVHEVREQGAGAGKKYVKRLHRRCFSMLAAHDRGSDWLSIS